MSTSSTYTWKSKCAGLEVSQLKRLKELQEEDRQLKTIVVGFSLDKVALRPVIEISGWCRSRVSSAGVGALQPPTETGFA